MKEAVWDIYPRIKRDDSDKVVCSECGADALYEKPDEHGYAFRALSRCCPNCGSLMIDAEIKADKSSILKLK